MFTRAFLIEHFNVRYTVETTRHKGRRALTGVEDAANSTTHAEMARKEEIQMYLSDVPWTPHPRKYSSERIYSELAFNATSRSMCFFVILGNTFPTLPIIASAFEGYFKKYGGTETHRIYMALFHHLFLKEREVANDIYFEKTFGLTKDCRLPSKLLKSKPRLKRS